MAEFDRGEKLGSFVAAGDIHAAYPSATYSLCGIQVAPARLTRRTPAAPTCDHCIATAEVFDGVDKSAPSAWRTLWA